MAATQFLLSLKYFHEGFNPLMYQKADQVKASDEAADGNDVSPRLVAA